MLQFFASDALTQEQFAEEVKAYPYSTIKLPQFATGGFLRGFEVWIEERPDTELLLMHRDPMEVALSMDKNGMQPFGKNVETAAKIVNERYDAFKEILPSQRISYVELKHDDFLDDPDDTLAQLAALSKLKLAPNLKVIEYYGASGDTPKSVWDNWFDKSKVNHHS